MKSSNWVVHENTTHMALGYKPRDDTGQNVGIFVVPLGIIMGSLPAKQNTTHFSGTNKPYMFVSLTRTKVVEWTMASRHRGMQPSELLRIKPIPYAYVHYFNSRDSQSSLDTK